MTEAMLYYHIIFVLASILCKFIINFFSYMQKLGKTTIKALKLIYHTKYIKNFKY